MAEQKKLKVSKIYLLALLGLYLPLSIVEDQLYNTHYSAWVYGAVLIGLSLGGVWMLRHLPLFAPALSLFSLGLAGGSLGLACWHYELAYHMETMLSTSTFQIHLLIMVLSFSMALSLIIFSNQRLENHYRQIFELAAGPVDAAGDGFTSRPYPAGNMEYSRQDLIGFSRFLDEARVAWPLVEEERMVLVLPGRMSSYSRVRNRDYADLTYVAFDYSGQVSVHMPQADYGQYRSRLTFDQLCASLAEVFKRFFTLYCSGESDQIRAAMGGDVRQKVWVLGGLILGMVVLLGLVISYANWH